MSTLSVGKIARGLLKIDRRAIYFLVAVALSLPLIFRVMLTPAPMPTADAYYRTVESLPRTKENIVLIAMDWGPNTQGENLPQTAVTIEHLMRKRIPFAVITIYALASPFLDQLPKEIAARLESENPGERWEYGKDWMNWGYIPNATVMIQGISKATDLSEHLKSDAYGTPLRNLPAMEGIKTIRNISMLVEITGLAGALSTWIQFFQGEDYRPPFVHGCTSISIPDAFIYFSSKQLVGLFEGLAGAAWYDKLLKDEFPSRKPSEAVLVNSSLAFAHLLIIAFIVLGNVGLFVSNLTEKGERK